MNQRKRLNARSTFKIRVVNTGKEVEFLRDLQMKRPVSLLDRGDRFLSLSLSLSLYFSFSFSFCGRRTRNEKRRRGLFIISEFGKGEGEDACACAARTVETHS